MPIIYARETGLGAAEYIAALRETTMRERRPIANAARIEEILRNSNLVITARENGTLVGVARCITDFHWICYCADLAVRESHQGKGIGRALLDKCSDEVGPRVGVNLVAYPEVVDFYRRLGMEEHPAFYRRRTDAS